VAANGDEKRALLRETSDTTVDKSKPGLTGFPHIDGALNAECGPPLTPVPMAYRAFDVQHVIPDDRLMDRPRAELWRVRSSAQLYVTEQHAQSIQPGGPGLVFTAQTPDMDHYKGNSGGRVLPLYASTDTSKPNLAPGLLDALAQRLGQVVTPEDFLAYVAAVTAHSAFTERFADDLRTPGIRVPLTADAGLWAEAVELGRRVLWLHTRGERCIAPGQGRTVGAPDIGDGTRRPLVTAAIPDTADRYPDEMSYDSSTQTLTVGEGQVTPVSPAVVDYEVSGMNVLRKWFGYRRATRPQSRGDQSALDDVRPRTWPSAYTTDLVELLRVLTLVTDLEPAQVKLLDKVMDAQHITVADLTAAGVLPVPDAARSPLPKLSRSQSTHGTLPGLALD
jgi:hypothetical protein